ncbi:MAG: protein kinase [Anaerolineae bacterium]
MSSETQDLTGQTIKGYELRERIGQGGFGAVYRAYQPAVDREVAIKVILPQHANNPEFIRRFESEAQVIARLEHLHIIPLYDYWREPDRALLVMRLLKGGSLQDSIEKNGAWGLTETSQLLDQIADALSVAHRQQIIHRDLKPANILLDENKNAYLADFGIAKKLSGEPQYTPEEDRYGSPAFISPEQVTGQAVSPQTDIYSLGMVLYVMLTGHTPFFDTSTGTVIRKQLSESLPPLQTFRTDLPYTINVIIWRATSKRPETRYPDAITLADDFRQAIAPDAVRGMVVSQLSSSTPPQTIDTRSEGKTVILGPLPYPSNPYKGLRAFVEADAPDFFGRTSLVDRLVAHLADPDHPTAFLAVVGPSGSGKSSVVSAGLVPALKRGVLFQSQDWYYLNMTPGKSPLQELADTLLSISLDPTTIKALFGASVTALATLVPHILPEPDTALVLVIDQFEEVFTLVNDERERSHFIQLLVNAVNSAPTYFRLIITMRADFFDRPLRYAGLSTLLRDHSEIILPLTTSEMEQAIIGPAARIGVQFEAGLVLKLIDDVNQQPGALPLLQFTLTELFERRQNYLLTHEAYRETGGVLGALARRADELFLSLSAIEQAATHQLFLRLVAIGENTDDTRRKIVRTELSTINADKVDVQSIIDLYGKHRLFTFDYEPGTRTPTVEIAHEALIKAWKRLQNWLTASRDELRLYQRFSTTANEWNNTNRNPDFLISGSRLAQFEIIEHSTVIALTENEKLFLQASIAARSRSMARVRMTIAGLVILAVAAMAFAIVAFDRQRAAETQQQRADLQASVARSRELAITALTINENLDLSLLLSLESLDAADTFEARNSLITTLQSRPRLLKFLDAHTDTVRTVSYSPDGSLLASAGRDNSIILWNTNTNKPAFPPLRGHSNWINSLSFNRNGTVVISASSDGTVRQWSTTTGQMIGDPIRASTAGEIWSIAFNPTLNQFATGDSDGNIRIWDEETGKALTPPIKAHQDIVYGLAYNPDGSILASGGGDGKIALLQTNDYSPVGAPLEDDNSFVLNLAFSPNGQQLASTGTNAIVDFWDPASGEFLYSIATGHAARVKGLSYSPDGRMLATSSDDNTLRLWDIFTREQIGEPLTGHSGSVWAVSFAPDGRTLASGGADNRVILWDTFSGLPLVQASLNTLDDILALAYSPNNKMIAYTGGLKNTADNSIHIIDPENNNELLTLKGHTSYVTGISFSPDSTRLVSVSPDQTIRVWDTGTGAMLFDTPLDDLNPYVPVAFGPDGSIIASGNESGTITLWSSKTGDKLGTLTNGHSAGVRALAFSPDGKLLVSGSVDRLLVIHNLATGLPIAAPLADYSDEIWAVAFAPSGQFVASGSTDYSINLWETATARPLGQPLNLHQDWVSGLAFTPDGSILASASHDGSIVLWDTKENKQLGKPLMAHSDYINAIAFSPDGNTMISGGEDQKLIFWSMNINNWRLRACAIANRNLSPQEWEQYFNGIPYHKTCD